MWRSCFAVGDRVIDQSLDVHKQRILPGLAQHRVAVQLDSGKTRDAGGRLQLRLTVEVVARQVQRVEEPSIVIRK